MMRDKVDGTQKHDELRDTFSRDIVIAEAVGGHGKLARRNPGASVIDGFPYRHA